MPRALIAILGLTLAVAWLVGPRPMVAYGVAGFDSAYQFESAFLGNLKPGDAGTFTVFFANTGSTTWAAGTATQVNLAACLDDKVTCNVAPEESAWNPGTWLSSTAYATHAKTPVVPGDFSAFTYSVKVPAAATVGSYRFNGDLVLTSTGAKIHAEGYFQDATVASVTTGTLAPSDVQVFTGNYDGGATNNDVRVMFTAPSTNIAQDYEIQRSPSQCPIASTSSAFVTAATVTVPPGVTGSYNDLNRTSGFWCYQVRIKDPTSLLYSYSNQQTATVFGPADTTRPQSLSAVLSSSAGFLGSLDANDIFAIAFTERMTVGTNATIRLTDGDCGPPVSQSSGPPACSGTSQQTVADVVCGSNANCALSLDGTTLTVTMTGNPIDQTAGSAPGVQFPAVVTDSLGITDAAGNGWDLTTSSDRAIGPQGQ